MAQLDLGNVRGPQGLQGVGIEEIVFKTRKENGDYTYIFKLTNGQEFEVDTPIGPQGIQGETGPVGPMPDMSDYQTKEDNGLATTAKEIVPAINELLEKTTSEDTKLKSRLDIIENYLNLEPKEDTLGNGYLGAFCLG